MATVSVQELVKEHRAPKGGVTRVLDGISLDISDGELLVLVGPSGCGKSTLLRCIAGLEPLSGGRILIGGDDVSRLEPRDRDLAMVFQSYALYPHLSVRENLAFGLRMRTTPAAEIAARVDEAAAMLELGSLLERRPAQLSGGQRQRVAIGRAVVRRPRAFLFDEPLSNLDASLRGQMRVELLQLHRRLGATMIYVTHDQVEAMTLADRICVLDRGQVQQLGTPAELYSRPARLFVARFIGTPEMNIVALDAARAAGLLPSAARIPESATQLGVRAEDIAISDGGAAEVALVELLGWEALVHLRVGALSLIARCESGRAPQRGDAAGIALAADKLHFFDAQGLRVA